MNENQNELQQQNPAEVARVREDAEPVPVYEPRVNIYESEDALVLVADFPGVRPEGLDITVEKNVLVLEGKAEEPDAGERRAVSLTWRPGQFRREFVLSQLIDQDGIKADMNNGVLVLTMPKVPESQPKKIAVVQK